MNTASPLIVSRFGNRIIEWDQATLNETLAMLRQERDPADTDTESLLACAEQIRRDALQSTPKESSA